MAHRVGFLPRMQGTWVEFLVSGFDMLYLWLHALFTHTHTHTEPLQMESLSLSLETNISQSKKLIEQNKNGS